MPGRMGFGGQADLLSSAAARAGCTPRAVAACAWRRHQPPVAPPTCGHYHRWRPSTPMQANHAYPSCLPRSPGGPFLSLLPSPAQHTLSSSIRYVASPSTSSMRVHLVAAALRISSPALNRTKRARLVDCSRGSACVCMGGRHGWWLAATPLWLLLQILFLLGQETTAGQPRHTQTHTGSPCAETHTRKPVHSPPLTSNTSSLPMPERR